MIYNLVSCAVANIAKSLNGSYGCHRTSGRHSSSCGAFFLLLLTFHALLLTAPVEANACAGCYNGGQLFLPNTIFGPCRCLCEANYAGPQCELVGKRSSPGSLGPDSPDLNNGLADTRMESKVNFLKDIWRRLKDEQDDSGSFRLPSRSVTAPKRKLSSPKTRRNFDNDGSWL